jgi:hypothetical protein
MKQFITTLLLAMTLALVGCRSDAQPGWGVRVMDWSVSTPERSGVPGIDTVSVRVGTYGPMPALVIWSDIGGGFDASWDKTRNAVKYAGRYSTRAGREFVAEGYTADGTSGPVTIDGQNFDLQAGALFLVATSGEKTVVKQLKRDGLRLEKETFEGMARTDDEVKAFFTEASKGQKP